MSKEAKLKAAVRRGVKLLDSVTPGWIDRIDLTKLDLRDPNCCMLGQLYGEDFVQGTRRLSNALLEARKNFICLFDVNCSELSVEEYGFDISFPCTLEKYSIITEEWTKVIEKRRAKEVSKERIRRSA